MYSRFIILGGDNIVNLDVSKYYKYANDIDCGLTFIHHNVDGSLEIVVQHMANGLTLSRVFEYMDFEIAPIGADIIMGIVKKMCDELIERYNDHENKREK